MSDIRLLRPAAGTNQAVACEPEANFVFEFPTDAATLSRSGDDLVMTFEDGTTLSLTDFYKTYSSENMPSFDVDGAQVAGADFFTAMNEPDLMPAAGPGGNTAPGGGRYHEYANMALYDGLDRLGGLDVGWPDGGYEPELEGGAGDDAGHINATPLIDNFTTTFDPEGTDPGTDPGSDPNAAGTGSAGIIVDEAAFAAGTRGDAGSGDSGHGYKGRGGFDVHLNGEGGTVTLTDPDGHQVTLGVDREGNVTVQQGTGLTVNGVLVNEFSGIVDGDGTLHVEYEYALEESRTHENGNSVGADDALRGQIGIHAVDGSGDTADGSLSVEVHDDGPVITGMTVTGAAENKVSDTARQLSGTLDGLHFGADADGSVVDVTVNGEQTFQGTVHVDEKGDVSIDFGENSEFTLNADGSFTYTRPGDEVDDGENSTYTFEVKITDADGDTATAGTTVTLTTPGLKQDPKNPPKEPDDPDNPPTDPDDDPDDPDNPGYPDEPKDPDTPENPGLRVAQVLVDEAQMADGSKTPDVPASGDAPAVFNPASGSGSFGVVLNGEDGTITLKYGDETVQLKVEDGKAVLPDGKTLTVQGVDVTIENMTKNDDGSWTVHYSYTLKTAQDHPDAGEVGADDPVGGDIHITVEDESGDTVEGSIHVQVHDDGPVISAPTVDKEKNVSSVTVNMGADHDGAYMDSDGNPVDAKVEVFEQDKDGKPTDSAISWKDATGNTKTDLTEMKEGETWTSDDMTVEKTGENSYDFKLNPGKPARELTVRATDADGDTDEQDLPLTTTPSITPKEPYSGTGTVNDKSVHLKVDEGSQPESSESNNTLDSAHDSHPQSGEGYFNVQLNGEGGTITLTDDHSHVVRMKVDREGNYQLVDEKGNPLSEDGKLMVNGVEVTLEANGTLKKGDDSAWEVKYSYKLSGPQQHTADDTTLTGEKITIEAMDESEDEKATAYLTAEVHDDMPEMSVAQDSATATASVTVDMGADADGVYDNGMGNATVEVFTQDSAGNVAETPLEWTKGDGSNTTDLTEMNEGDTWTSTSGDVTVHKYGDQYEFTNNSETTEQDLTVKTTDADGDTVQDDVHLDMAETDITVGTPKEDTLTPGAPSDPDNPGTTPPSFESSSDNGTNDFVIGDIYDQHAEGNVGNFAFLVDTSSSLSTDDLATMIDGLKNAIQSIIDALKENGGSAEVLVSEFNLFARHAHELHLTGESTLDNIDGEHHSLQDILGEFHRGGEAEKGSDLYSDYSRRGMPTGMLGTTNYDAAMELAREWFESKGSSQDKNQTFFITDGEPTAHIEDEPYSGQVGFSNGSNITGDQLNNALKDITWTPGTETDFWIGKHHIYVDAAGVLYTDSDHTELLLGTGTEGGWLSKSPTPLVLQDSDDNGTYEAHRVGGQFRGVGEEDIKQAHGALEGLTDISDVVILGVGSNWTDTGNVDKVIGDLQDKVEKNTGVNFEEIAEAIQKSLKDLDPASDLLIGGKGNDILFGDRVDYEKTEEYQQDKSNVEDVTQNALFALAASLATELDVPVPAEGNLADLAGFIREHAKDFGDKLDKLGMDKGGGDDVLIGGTGHDVLYGQGGDDLLIGDGGQGYLDYLSGSGNDSGLNALHDQLQWTESKTDEELTNALNNLDSYENADTAHGDDLLFGGDGNDILLGGAGNDKLFGGNGEDILYGGTGNDYLDGGDGKDYLYGGAGDDLIVYDESDFAVFGGDGIDVLLSNDTADTLSDLVKGIDGKPHVNGVEVFLKGSEGHDVEDLTSLSDLADKAHITITDTDGDGNGDRLALGEGWKSVEGTNTYVNDDLGLTVELQNMEQVDPETNQLVFQLQNTNS